MNPLLSIAVQMPVSTPSSYRIHIGSGLLERSVSWMPKSVNRVVIITDNTIKKRYANYLVDELKNQGYQTLLLAFPAGEKFKTISTKCHLEERMLRHHCGRDSLILAVGGGVVGDLAGFIAATYMRGIPYIQVPTTLLAMVDSSIGGKTGIDTPQGKNLVGCFWQPHAVVSDIACLKTLPKKQLINGLIEAVKVFLTHDVESFRYVQANLGDIIAYDDNALEFIVHKAAAIKATVVSQDEKESNLRMVLNFGHTIGHALEYVSNYKLLHGYAVAYGILIEAKIAQLMGFLSSTNYLLIESFMEQVTILATDLKKMDGKQIIKATRLDKKVKNGKVNYVLLREIGAVYEHDMSYAHPVPDSIVKQALFETLGVLG